MIDNPSNINLSNPSKFYRENMKSKNINRVRTITCRYLQNILLRMEAIDSSHKEVIVRIISLSLSKRQICS